MHNYTIYKYSILCQNLEIPVQIKEVNIQHICKIFTHLCIDDIGRGRRWRHTPRLSAQGRLKQIDSKISFNFTLGNFAF